MIRILFCLFILFTSCSDDTIDSANPKNKNILIDNFVKQGYAFFTSIDSFNMVGVNPVKDLYDDHVKFGIQTDTSRNAIYLIRVEKNNYSGCSFYRVNGWLVSTEMSYETEMGLYYRDITVIKPDVIYRFEYLMDDNREILETITFHKKSGKTAHLYNNLEHYLDYQDIVFSDSIPTCFEPISVD